MSSGIQGSTLEITVVCCTKLKETTWFTKQHPYIVLDYAGTKYRTTTCIDGGTNPTFNEKFRITLVEGLSEVEVTVWKKKSLKQDGFVGSGRIQLQKVLKEGFDDSTWMLESNSTDFSGELKVIMRHQPVVPPPAPAAPSPYPERVPYPPPPQYPYYEQWPGYPHFPRPPQSPPPAPYPPNYYPPTPPHDYHPYYPPTPPHDYHPRYPSTPPHDCSHGKP